MKNLTSIIFIFICINCVANSDSLRLELDTLQFELNSYLFAKDKVEDSLVAKKIYEAKSIANQLGNNDVYAQILRVEGLRMLNDKTNLGQAVSKLDSAFSISFQAKDSIGISKGHACRAEYYLVQSKNEEALEHLLSSLEYVSRKNKIELLQRYYALAHCYSLLKQEDQSEYFYNKILNLNVTDLGYLPKSIYYKMTADAYHKLERHGQSEVFLNRILKSDTSLLSSQDLMDIYFKLGTIYSHDAKDDLAFDFYHKSLAIGKQIKDSILLPDTKYNLGITYFLMNERDSAIKHLSESIIIFSRNERHLDAADAHSTLGDLFLHSESYLNAEKNYNSSLTIATKHGDLTRQVESLMDLADAQFSNKNYKTSSVNATKVISHKGSKVKDINHFVIRAMTNIGDCLFEQNKFSSALSQYEKTLEECSKLSIEERKALILYNMAWVKIEQNKLVDAGILLNKGFKNANSYHNNSVKGQICEAAMYLKYQLKYEGALPKVCESY